MRTKPCGRMWSRKRVRNSLTDRGKGFCLLPSAESRQRKVTWPSAKETRRWLEMATRWVSRPRYCSTYPGPPKGGSTREGKVHIFHLDSPDEPSDVETLTTEYAKTMDIGPKTHNLFLSTADFAEASAPSAEHPHPSRRPIPGTFHVLIYGRWRLGTNC